MKTQSVGISIIAPYVFRDSKQNMASHTKGFTAALAAELTMLPTVARLAAIGEMLASGDDTLMLASTALEETVINEASGMTHMLHPVDSWLGISQALSNYIENRGNGIDIDSPDESLPDGKISQLGEVKVSNRAMDWPTDSGKFKWKLTLSMGERQRNYYWTKNKDLGWPDANGRYWFDVHNNHLGLHIQGFSAKSGTPIEFDDAHSPRIRRWMERKDCNYLKRIYREDPVLFFREFAQLKAANLNHPAISQMEAEISARKTLSPFYEDKVPTVSIAKIPFSLTTVASSRASSSSHYFQVEQAVLLSTELLRMGLSEELRCVRTLTRELKQTRWQTKTEAHQEILHWVIKLHPEICVSLFQIALKSADNLDIQLIAFMMHASKSVVMFKLPFSLSSILWREKDSDKEALRQLIYLALKRIAEEQIISDPESKCIAMFKLVLKSALKKGMITAVQFHQLDSIAVKTDVFSDERFLALKKEIEILKQQFSSLDVRMGIAEKNLQLVADSVMELKKAFQRQQQRKLLFSIATIGLSFVCAHGAVEAITGIIDLADSAGIADLSDLAEVGAAALHIPVEQAQSYLDDGLQALEQNKRIIAQQGASMMLKGIGLDPDKFLETWVSANIVLQGSPQDKGRLMQPVTAASSVSFSSSSSFYPTPYKAETVKRLSTPGVPTPSSSSPSLEPLRPMLSSNDWKSALTLPPMGVSTTSHSSQSLEPRPLFSSNDRKPVTTSPAHTLASTSVTMGSNTNQFFSSAPAITNTPSHEGSPSSAGARFSQFLESRYAPISNDGTPAPAAPTMTRATSSRSSQSLQQQPLSTNTYRNDALTSSPYLPASTPPSPYLPVSTPPSPYLPVSTPPSLYLPVSTPPSLYLPVSTPPSPYLPASTPSSLYLPASTPPSPYPPASTLPFFSSALAVTNTSSYGSSSAAGVQSSASSFFAQPSLNQAASVDGIILQNVSASEFRISINYPKLRLSPQQRNELQEILTGNDGTGAFGYIEASAKTMKGVITELSFEDKHSADILISELNGKLTAWKSEGLGEADAVNSGPGKRGSGMAQTPSSSSIAYSPPLSYSSSPQQVPGRGRGTPIMSTRGRERGNKGF